MRQVPSRCACPRARGRHARRDERVGGMNPHYEAADIVAVVDHINLMGDIRPSVSKGLARPPLPGRIRAIRSALPAAHRSRSRADPAQGRCSPWPGRIWRPAPNTASFAGPEPTSPARRSSRRRSPRRTWHAPPRVLGRDRSLPPDALEAAEIGRILANAAKAEPNLTRLVTRVLAELPPRTSSA